MIILTINGIKIPESDLPHYAIRFSYKAGKLEPALYESGKRTTFPWNLTMEVDHPGGGDVSG
jgi:hypothetical protein